MANRVQIPQVVVNAEKKSDEEIVFMSTRQATWRYNIVPDGNVVIDGVAFHQKGKKVELGPGTPLRTRDPQVIEFFRNHPDYGLFIKEYGVHFGDKVAKKAPVEV